MRSRQEELWAAAVARRFFSGFPCRLETHEYLNRKGTSSKHQSKAYLFNYWPQIWDVQATAASDEEDFCPWHFQPCRLSESLKKERKEGGGRGGAFWKVWGGGKNRLDVYSVTLHLEESIKKFESIERGSGSRRKIAVKKYNPLFFSREKKKTYESLMQFNIFS